MDMTTTLDDLVNLSVSSQETKQRKMHVIAHVAQYVKAFNGDVFGSFVRDWIFRGESHVRDLDCRIDANLYDIFIKILSTIYKVERVDIDDQYDFFRVNILTYKISPYVLSFDKFEDFTIDIVPLTVEQFSTTPSDFDVNLLIENSVKTYLKFIPSCFSPFIDKIGYIRQRIAEKRFCLVERSTTEAITSRLIERSIKMVKNQWKMDDAFLKEKSWIVTKWTELYFNTEKCRMYLSDTKRKIIVACSECTLCQHKFAATDIVVNLSCHHSFHWQCNERIGLKNWVTDQCKTSCPNCRKSMLYS